MTDYIKLKECKAPFQIDGCITTMAFIDDKNLTFQPQVYNVQKEPLSWTLVSFGGDIQNVSIDSLTGEVTYDVVSQTLANNGNANFIITATDACGNSVTRNFCFKVNDPVSVIPLACNSDLQENNPEIVDKLILFAKTEEGSLYQDLAKTILATSDGEPVSVMEDATGAGDITVRSNDDSPSLSLSVVNGENALFFSGNNQALQYDVPSAPAAGSAFKFFTLVQVSSGGNNASVISSTLQANNNFLNNGTWQICRSGSSFVFRSSGGWSNIVLGGLITNASDLGGAFTWGDFTDGNYHLIYCDYDGTTLSMYVDGVLQIQADPNDNLLGQHLKIFENRDGSVYMQGYMAEMLYADATMNQDEALTTQAYFICKYGLDASLLAYASPFEINLNTCYGTVSQFEYHILSNGDKVVYDTANNTYYQVDNVPAPDLGLLNIPTCASSNTNTQNTVVSTDGSVGISEGQNAAGEIEYDLSVPSPSLNVTKETVRVVRDYSITSSGVVTPIGASGPIPNVTWAAGNGNNGNGNDYILTFPTTFPNPAIQVTVAGDIETGSGGDTNNAFTVQNARMVSSTVAGFTLYSGDDGGSEDDAGRRDVNVRISYDKEIVIDVEVV